MQALNDFRRAYGNGPDLPEVLPNQYVQSRAHLDRISVDEIINFIGYGPLQVESQLVCVQLHTAEDFGYIKKFRIAWTSRSQLQLMQTFHA